MRAMRAPLQFITCVSFRANHMDFKQKYNFSCHLCGCNDWKKKNPYFVHTNTTEIDAPKYRKCTWTCSHAKWNSHLVKIEGATFKSANVIGLLENPWFWLVNSVQRYNTNYPWSMKILLFPVAFVFFSLFSTAKHISTPEIMEMPDILSRHSHT